MLGRTFVVLRDHINCRQMEEIASRTRTLIAPRRRPKTRSQAQREPRSVSLPSNGQGRDERPMDNAEQPTLDCLDNALTCSSFSCTDTESLSRENRLSDRRFD